jgi:hypothetical protein
MGVGDLVEGECSRDRGAQCPVGEAVADEALQRRKLGVVPREIGEGEPANGEVAPPFAVARASCTLILYGALATDPTVVPPFFYSYAYG